MLATFLFVVYFIGFLFIAGLLTGYDDADRGRSYDDTPPTMKRKTYATPDGTLYEWMEETDNGQGQDLGTVEQTETTDRISETVTSQAQAPVRHSPQEEEGLRVSQATPEERGSEEATKKGLKGLGSHEQSPLPQVKALGIRELRKLASQWNKEHPDRKIKGASKMSKTELMQLMRIEVF